MSFYQERYLPVCNYFNTPAGCRFGKYCRFGHIQYSNILHHGGEEQVFLNSPDQTDTCSFTDQSSTSGSFYEAETYTQNYYRKKTCRYFQTDNTCPYGESCKFLHSNNYSESQPDEFLNQEFQTPIQYEGTSEQHHNHLQFIQEGESTSDDFSTQNVNKESDRICKFFLSDRCHFGARCRFVHPAQTSKDSGIEDQQYRPATNNQNVGGRNSWRNDKGERQPPRVYQPKHAYRPIQPNANVICIDSITDEDRRKCKDTEINVIKKRFGKDLEILEENDTDFQFVFTFSPSDPDWPYDVKKFDIEITIPEQYPKEIFTLKLPTDQNLPETVRRGVEWSLIEWTKLKSEVVQKSRNAELFFRPFLKWLDKNIEDIVTEGLKQYKKELVAQAAGLEFVPASQLKSMVIKDDGTESESRDVVKDGANTYIEDNPESASQNVENGAEENSVPVAPSNSLKEPQKRGTEIVLGNLQLRENAATLMCQQLNIVIQCNRCKGKTEFSTPQGRTNSVECTQCHSTQLLIFRASLVHQFSSVIGYLDLNNCVPFDLILSKSLFQVGCLNCSKETKMEGLSPGHPHDAWCHSCHYKIKIAVDAVKFHQLEATSVVTDSAHTVKIDKVQKQKKDPAIQEGKPLPENGTCKHYKKSYRWLRFPCCGKCYPCDVCHDDQENHEMVYANRMICGFCCKEQSFAADRPCVACMNAMTKSTSEHWEGGKGCRDKIRMSKQDNQKYANLSKTTSRHAQKVGDMKKKTKLRHS